MNTMLRKRQPKNQARGRVNGEKASREHNWRAPFAVGFRVHVDPEIEQHDEDYDEDRPQGNVRRPRHADALLEYPCDSGCEGEGSSRIMTRRCSWNGHAALLAPGHHAASLGQLDSDIAACTTERNSGPIGVDYRPPSLPTPDLVNK